MSGKILAGHCPMSKSVGAAPQPPSAGQSIAAAEHCVPLEQRTAYVHPKDGVKAHKTLTNCHAGCHHYWLHGYSCGSCTLECRLVSSVQWMQCQPKYLVDTHWPTLYARMLAAVCLGYRHCERKSECRGNSLPIVKHTPGCNKTDLPNPCLWAISCSALDLDIIQDQVLVSTIACIFALTTNKVRMSPHYIGSAISRGHSKCALNANLKHKHRNRF